jgi:hypothetical protein
LGGELDLNLPVMRRAAILNTSKAHHRGDDSGELVAERIAVESYGEIIRYLGNDDPTRIMIEASWLKKKSTPKT